jgi:hypothetical protein
LDFVTPIIQHDPRLLYSGITVGINR